MGETVTYLQILGCELHQNASGGQVLPGPAMGAMALPKLLTRYYDEGRGRGRKGLGIRKDGKGIGIRVGKERA